MKKRLLALLSVSLILSTAHATTNEITVSCTLIALKGAVSIQRAPGAQMLPYNGTRWHSYVLPCTTTNAALGKGSVGTLGYCYVRNLSTNAVIELTCGTLTNMTLKAGEVSLFRWAGAFPIASAGAQTTSGGGDLEVTILED